MPRALRSGKQAYTAKSLSHGQLWELLLGFAGQRDEGCTASCNDLAHDTDSGCPTWFADATEAATAWFACRDELLPGAPGVRPAGWWRWEARRPRPGTGDQRAVLEEMGELESWETAALNARSALVRS